MSLELGLISLALGLAPFPKPSSPVGVVMVDIVDYVNRTRRGAPLPPVSEADRLALRYTLEMAATTERRVIERSGSLCLYTREGVERLLAQAEVLKTAPKKDD